MDPEALKDQGLGDEVRQIEETVQLNTDESRALIKAAIERRYTSPA
jgi:hypothetical protein